MRKLVLVLFALILSLMPVATASAQYEGTDAKYREERRASRSNRGLVKLGIAGVVLVISGGAWVVKKIRGSE